jgi:hypothetical protein
MEGPVDETSGFGAVSAIALLLSANIPIKGCHRVWTLKK